MINMKCQVLFSQKNNQNKFRMLSGTVLLSTLWINIQPYLEFSYRPDHKEIQEHVGLPTQEFMHQQ